MRAIFTLHAVDLSGSVLSITPDALEGLLDGLAAAGHRVVPLPELLATPGVPDQVALTFDDALASVVEEALPILARRGLSATVFAVTDHMGSDTRWPGQREAPSSTMGWGELEALVESGWDVGSHTRRHPDLRGLDAARLEDEIGGAAEAIRSHLGRDPIALAWPAGWFDVAARAAAQRHHRWGVSTRLAVLDAAVDEPLTLPRLDAYYFRSRWTHAGLGGPAVSGWIQARARLRALRGSA